MIAFDDSIKIKSLKREINSLKSKLKYRDKTQKEMRQEIKELKMVIRKLLK